MRRRDIQGLRAIAIMMVVAFHAGVGVPGGFAGVDVFFVISGFVITGTLLRELGARGGVDLPRFYARRVKRLFPALAAMLIFVAVAGVLLIPVGSGHVTATTGIFASLFTANFYLYSLPTGYFASSVQLDPLLHTWTLAVEEQFYLVFPAVLLGAWWLGSQLGRPRAIATLLVGAVCGMSFILALGWADGSSTFGSVSSPRAFAFYASPARGWEFGVGCVAALLAPLLRRMPTLVGFALARSECGDRRHCPDDDWRRLAVADGRRPDIGVLRPPPGRVRGRQFSLALAGAEMRCGRRSLLQPLPLALAVDRLRGCVFPGSGWAAPMAAAVAFAPAWASYRFLENPVRRNPRVHGRVVVAIAIGCVALPITASLGLAAIQPHLPNPSQAARLHADVLRGCDNALPYGDPRRPAACTSTTPRAQGSVVLIGDSNAGQFIEPFVLAANRAGFDATTATLRDCPFAQLQVHFRLGQGKTCAVFNRRSLENLLRARPALVIIAARTDWYLNAPGAGQASVAALTSRRWTGNPSRKATLFTRGLHDEIKALNAAGVPVVLVHPVPVLPINEQGCAAVLLMLNGCRKSLPRSTVETTLRAARRVEDTALAGQLAAWSVDFEDELCSRRGREPTAR